MAKILLYEETEGVLKRHGYTKKDVQAVYGNGCEITCGNFWELAFNTCYDNGYGCEHVPVDLMLHMNDGSFFIRDCYDGAEGWKHVAKPKNPARITARTLYSEYGGCLYEINQQENL